MLAILTSIEECRLSRSATCFGENVYTCYDHVHLDIMSDISAYRTVVKPQRTAIQINANREKDKYGQKYCSYYLRHINRHMYVTVR